MRDISRFTAISGDSMPVSLFASTVTSCQEPYTDSPRKSDKLLILLHPTSACGPKNPVILEAQMGGIGRIPEYFGGVLGAMQS